MASPAGPGGVCRRETFTFGVPLIARESAANWGRVTDLLELTLRSVHAQTDPDFRLLLAGHDEPESWKELTRGDSRFRFLPADWPPQSPTTRNDDAGCKRWMIKETVRGGGGGLLMYLDADDLVDRRLVETVRAMVGPDHVGAIVTDGVVLDFATLRVARLPNRRVFDGPFHRLCGSSTIGRVEPASPDPLRRDTHAALGSHHQWLEAADAAGAALVQLPIWGAYFVNTAENHSELHGPFKEWRRTMNANLARHGLPADQALLSRFGLDLRQLAAMGAGGTEPEPPVSSESRPLRDHGPTRDYRLA